MSPRKPPLDVPRLEAIVREAREQPLPEVDWDKVEGPLMMRVEREARARSAIEAYEGRSRGWLFAAFALSAAAAAAFFFARGSGDTLESFDALSHGSRAAHDPSAGAMSWKDANATLQLTHEGLAHDASAGESIQRGDTIEAHRGRVVFARTEPSGVTWGLEDNARASIRATRGTLILALERGAVEAQVAPVATGEAFAIDVEGARVAVHGTHLRVSRDGTRATVDLREGVVSIGAPPAHGSTYGDLITAPAHVEFDSSDPHGTLKVSHDVSRVRAASPLERAPEVAAPPPPPRPATAPAPSPPPAGASRATPAAAPPPAAPALTVPPPVPTPPTPPQADVDPDKTITEAVRACLRARVGQTTGVVLTVSSNVELTVADNGMVSAARFEPPLAPEVQQCAAKTIYRVRFSAPGAVRIPLDVTP
jgi:hypothetical protein